MPSGDPWCEKCRGWPCTCPMEIPKTWTLPGVEFGATYSFSTEPVPASEHMKAPYGIGTRRQRVDLGTRAEDSIRDALRDVEQAGCDRRLTEVVQLLDRARELFADWYEAEVVAGREFGKRKDDTFTDAEYREDLSRVHRYLFHYGRATILGVDGKPRVHMSIPRKSLDDE